VLRHEEATHTRVLDALDDASILHLSCHGTTDWSNPLDSGLLLANDELLTVRQLMERKLAGGRLGSLSACETGMVGANIPDEMVMLPTALLQAGFAGILASLWSIPELSTALLMDRFYAQWATDGVEPGAALRNAQRWLRDVTASELAERFRVDSDAADDDHRDALRDMWLEFAAMEPDERPYSHAVHWAAFTLTGV
jgi:CHAT domain-containing protein